MRSGGGEGKGEELKGGGGLVEERIRKIFLKKKKKKKNEKITSCTCSPSPHSTPFKEEEFSAKLFSAKFVSLRRPSFSADIGTE